MSDDDELQLDIPTFSPGRKQRAGDVAYWIFWLMLVGAISTFPPGPIATAIYVTGWLLGTAQYCTTHRGEHGGAENFIVGGIVGLPIMACGAVIGLILISVF